MSQSEKKTGNKKTGSADAGAGKKRARVETKALVLARVRCECTGVDTHQNPWLGNLYVLWAPKPDKDSKESVKFRLGKTNARGYLNPTPEEDADARKGHVMFHDVPYKMYLIRHPDEKFVKELADGVNAGQKTMGEAAEYVPKIEDAGKDAATGKDVKELVLRLPADPEKYYPKGGGLYAQWVLYREMPHQFCPKVIAQVKRLQCHLGTMRYPIGGPGDPYSPPPLTKRTWSKKDKKFEELPNPYGNAGVFEVVTWNCVLAFQRDASGLTVRRDASGQQTSVDRKEPAGAQVKRKTFSKFLGPAPDFEPLPASFTEKYQIQHAREFVEAPPVKPSAATVKYETVVDEDTAKAIVIWLTNEYRKPGPVVISHGDGDSWMDSRAIEPFDNWSNRLKQLGFKPGVMPGNVLRDVRIGMKTGGGQIATSIHKSGFALDLLFSADTGMARPDKYPIRYAKGGLNARNRQLWIVYAPVQDSDIPQGKEQIKDASGTVVGYRLPSDPHAKYVKYIAEWNYDANDPAGGVDDLVDAEEGESFLNLTEVANAEGWVNISAHLTGWEMLPEETITLNDRASFDQMLHRLSYYHQRKDQGMELNGAPANVSEAQLGILNKWAALKGNLAASPDQEVDPATPTGQEFIRELKKKFQNRKVQVTYHPPDPPHPKVDYSEKKLTIDKKTTFLGDVKFTIRPITEPELKKGDTLKFPQSKGFSKHMEWWHFQLHSGYEDKKWGELLNDMGWTEEGLTSPRNFGKDKKPTDGVPIYGLYGLQYSHNDFITPVS